MFWKENEIAYSHPISSLFFFSVLAKHAVEKTHHFNLEFTKMLTSENDLSKRNFLEILCIIKDTMHIEQDKSLVFGMQNSNPASELLNHISFLKYSNLKVQQKHYF